MIRYSAEVYTCAKLAESGRLLPSRTPPSHSPVPVKLNSKSSATNKQTWCFQELEELCLVKFCEVLTERGQLGSLRRRNQLLEEDMRK